VSNKLRKMEKDQQKANSYDFTKGGNVYGRVVGPQNPQAIADETWKIAYRVFMEVALETLENEFQFGQYMRDVFIKEFTKKHECIASTGEQARECLRRCEERLETEQVFER